MQRHLSLRNSHVRQDEKQRDCKAAKLTANSQKTNFLLRYTAHEKLACRMIIRRLQKKRGTGCKSTGSCSQNEEDTPQDRERFSQVHLKIYTSWRKRRFIHAHKIILRYAIIYFHICNIYNYILYIYIIYNIYIIYIYI